MRPLLALVVSVVGRPARLFTRVSVVSAVAAVSLADCAPPPAPSAAPQPAASSGGGDPRTALAPGPASPVLPCAPGSACSPGALAAAPGSTSVAQPPFRYDRDTYHKLAAELDQELSKRVLDFWFPKIVDPSHPAFAQTLRGDGALADDGSRFLVFQARMTWFTAEIARRYPEHRDEYTKYATAGLAFLEKSLWDKKAGGLYWELDAHSKPVAEKHVYGIAFGMYAAAAVAGAMGESPQATEARDFALKVFDWLEKHAHDAAHGGYYEALTREGKPVLVAPKGKDPSDIKKDAIGTAYGKKSMNTHIHVLEALTALCHVAPTATVKQRLDEVFHLIEDRIFDANGYLGLYFAPDWTVIPAAESYGHNVETAFLLLEAADALGIGQDAKTRAVARKLVDRALDHGWDETNGGFFNEGETSGKATDRRKVWWVEAEGLNGLLAMHELYGVESDRYWKAFTREWQIIATKVSDREHGEWWGYLGPAGEIEDAKQEKGNKWKACYHNGRALMVSADKLRRLAGP